MHGSSSEVRFTRRSLALGGFGLAAAVGAGVKSVVARQTNGNLEGDCYSEPGVALLLDWKDELLNMRREEVLAPVGWQLFTDVNSRVVLQIPRDWKVQLGWATSFTRSGAPILDPTPNPNAGIMVTRFLNSDSTIAYEYTSMDIQGAALKPLEAANVAIQAILGENPKIEEICTFEGNDVFATSWITAHHHRSSMLVTVGHLLTGDVGFGPYTNVVYESFYAPRKSFETVVREYFIRFLYQQLPTGGSGDPTPTPTPEF